MSYLSVGVVDYGIGNHASVTHCLRGLGFRVRVSADTAVLDATDVLILPGVGAFPPAMQALHDRNLVSYLQHHAHQKRPIVGICLGMQLLSTASYELKYTPGLDIIPGEVVAMPNGTWHIGWNTIESAKLDPLLKVSEDATFYFNHSFCYKGAPEFQVAISRHPDPFVSVIRRANAIGVQFHPEKSQNSGKEILKNIISGLTHA